MSAAYYQPQPMLREVAIDPAQSVVLFVDIQNYNCHRDGAMYHAYNKAEIEVGAETMHACMVMVERDDMTCGAYLGRRCCAIRCDKPELLLMNPVHTPFSPPLTLTGP
jgi:hypothetical protein